MKKQMARLIIMSLICLSVSYSWARSGHKWDPVDPSDWEVDEGSRKGITNAAILSERVSVDHRNPGDVRYDLYRRIRILSDAGRKWGDVIAPTLQPNQRIKSIYGRTLLPNGQAFHLEKDHIFEKTVLETKGTQIEQTSFSMPGVTDNCIVEYRIEYALPGLGGMLWQVQKEIFLLDGELRWRFFRGKGVSDKAYRKGFMPNWNLRPATLGASVEKLPSADNPKELRVTIENVTPFEPEPYGLPVASLKSRLDYYYSSGDSQAAYWKTLSQDREKELKKFCRRNKRARKMIAAFGELATREERIKAAYDWLQSNIEITSFLGKDDKSRKRNKSADDVLKRGYGTPEDINTVFYDMLQGMNIAANIAFVVDRDRRLFDPGVKYWQFNSSLVVVPPEGPGTVSVFSPGSRFLPAGSVPWQNEGIPAFLIGDPDHLFITILFSDAGTNRTDRAVDLSLSPGLELSGKGREEYTGHIGHKLRLRSHRGGETVHSDEILEVLSRIYYDAGLDSMTFQQMEDPGSPVVLGYTIAFPGQEDTMGSRLLLQPTKYLERANNPFQTDRRESPVLLPYASQTDEVLTIALPDGWEVEASPSRQSFKNQAGSCEASFSERGNTLIVERQFRVERAYFPKSDYPSVRELYQFRQGLDGLSFILRRR